MPRYLCESVTEAFVTLHERGLIYRYLLYAILFRLALLDVLQFMVLYTNSDDIGIPFTVCRDTSADRSRRHSSHCTSAGSSTGSSRFYYVSVLWLYLYILYLCIGYAQSCPQISHGGVRHSRVNHERGLISRRLIYRI